MRSLQVLACVGHPDLHPKITAVIPSLAPFVSIGQGVDYVNRDRALQDVLRLLVLQKLGLAAHQNKLRTNVRLVLHTQNIHEIKCCGD